jgi:hypothetical protein
MRSILRRTTLEKGRRRQSGFATPGTEDAIKILGRTTLGARRLERPAAPVEICHPRAPQDAVEILGRSTPRKAGVAGRDFPPPGTEDAVKILGRSAPRKAASPVGISPSPGTQDAVKILGRSRPREAGVAGRDFPHPGTQDAVKILRRSRPERAASRPGFRASRKGRGVRRERHPRDAQNFGVARPKSGASSPGCTSGDTNQRCGSLG